MASGRGRNFQGAFVGTGAAINIRTVGFRPNIVELFNEDGLCTGTWLKSMADDSMIKRVTAGTMTVVTSDGVTPLSNGFTLGADSDMNVSGEKVFWVAYE